MVWGMSVRAAGEKEEEEGEEQINKAEYLMKLAPGESKKQTAEET